MELCIQLVCSGESKLAISKLEMYCSQIGKVIPFKGMSNLSKDCGILPKKGLRLGFFVEYPIHMTIEFLDDKIEDDERYVKVLRVESKC